MALTVDTDEYPPKVLLVRGIADVELVDGILDEYLPTNQKRSDPKQFAQWEAEIRSLYKQMVRIEIRPTWAKVLDFETRIPSAVQELAEQAARHVE